MIDKSHTHFNLQFLSEYEDFYDFHDIYEQIRQIIESSLSKESQDQKVSDSDQTNK